MLVWSLGAGLTRINQSMNAETTKKPTSTYKVSSDLSQRLLPWPTEPLEPRFLETFFPLVVQDVVVLRVEKDTKTIREQSGNGWQGYTSKEMQRPREWHEKI